MLRFDLGFAAWALTEWYVMNNGLVMTIGARIKNALDQLVRDARELARDLAHYFDTMSNETRILFFVMFIITIFYMVVRRPNETKESGGMVRQFMFALAIVLIFGLGIGSALDFTRDQITRI